MTGTNETVSIIKSENEHEYPTNNSTEITASQENNVAKKLPENEDEITERHNDSKCTKSESIPATSTAPKNNVVIDLKGPQLQKTRKENLLRFIYSWLFNSLLWRYKNRKDGLQTKPNSSLQQQECPKQERQIKVWVEYSLGGSCNGANYDSDRLNFNFNSRRTFITLLMFLEAFMFFVTAVIATFVYNSAILTYLFNDNGLVLLVIIFAALALIYPAFMLLPCLRESPYNATVLIFMVIAMTLCVSLITVLINTIVLIHTYYIMTFFSISYLLLAYHTDIDFTSYWLHFIGVIIAFVITLFVASFTMIALRMPVGMPHVIILSLVVLVHAVTFVMNLQAVISGKVEWAKCNLFAAAFMLYTSIINIFVNCIQFIWFMLSFEN